MGRRCRVGESGRSTARNSNWSGLRRSEYHWHWVVTELVGTDASRKASRATSLPVLKKKSNKSFTLLLTGKGR